MSEKIYRKVQIWLHSRNSANEVQILLLRTNASRGQFWQPVTGKVTDDEPFEDAAVREVLEETGIKIDTLCSLEHEFYFNVKKPWFQGKVREVCFYAEVQGCPKITIEPQEHDDYSWLSVTEALSRVKFDSNKRVLEKLLKKIGYKPDEPAFEKLLKKIGDPVTS